jgi:hypothetical protein
MTTTEIKKEMQNTIKANGWNKCYGTYGISLTAGTKQMEKGNAVISFGYIVDERYDAEATYKKFTESKEFSEMLQKINGTWVREVKKDGGWDLLYIRVYF